MRNFFVLFYSGCETACLSVKQKRMTNVDCLFANRRAFSGLFKIYFGRKPASSFDQSTTDVETSVGAGPTTENS